MKLTKKSKAIFIFSCLAIGTGVVYQNCGKTNPVNQSAAPEAKQTQSVLLQSLRAGESNQITITLKDGTAIKLGNYPANKSTDSK